MKLRHTLAALVAATSLGFAAAASAESPDHSFSWYDYLGASNAQAAGASMPMARPRRIAMGNPEHSFEWSKVLRAHRREVEHATWGPPGVADEGRESPN